MTNHTLLSFFPARRRAWRACVLGLVVCVRLAPAQTAPANPAKPAKDEVVSLAEFTVSGDAQTGYVASETMTGSRLPTKIKDLPYNIEVTTSEFLEDFNITDPSEMVNGGVITLDQDAGNSYTVRGISATGQLYNGFWQPAGIPVPTALIDRREVLKGPSAGVYGQTAPGGMLNIVPKQPKTTREDDLTLVDGNHDTHQARFAATGPLAARTAYLAVLSYDERGFMQPWREDRDRLAAFSLAHKFSDRSSLQFDLVAASQRNRSPSNRVPYLFNSNQADPVVTKNKGYYTGYALNLQDLNATGPGSYKNNDNYSVFGTYQRRLSDVFSLRAGGDWYANNTRKFNTSDITAYDPLAADFNSNPYNSSFFGLVRFRNAGSSYTAPSYQIDNKDGGGAQADLLAHYWLLDRKIENKSLLTLDFSSMYDYVIKQGMPQKGTYTASTDTVSTSNAVDTTIIPATPLFAGDTSYWVPLINPNLPAIYNDPTSGLPVNIYNVPPPNSPQYILSSWQKTRVDDFGVMLRQQSTLWQKALLYGSLRFDNVMYNNFTIQYPSFSKAYHPEWTSAWQKSYVSKNTNPVSHYHSDAFTPGGGVSYRITPEISAYANYSQSFKASVQQVTGATTGSYFLPNERAIGYDYGFKAAMLQERLTYTVGGFYILQKNMSVTSIDALGNSIKEASGTVTSKGAEVTFNYMVSENVAFNAGYYYTNARWGETGSDLDLQGRHKALVPPDILTAAGTYKFGGSLKGLRVFARYQYSSPTHAEDGGGQTTTGLFVQNGVTKNGTYTPVGANNGLRDIILASYYTVDAGAAYDFKSRAFDKRFTQHLQFNVKNVFDRRYVTFSRAFGDDRSYQLSYRIGF